MFANIICVTVNYDVELMRLHSILAHAHHAKGLRVVRDGEGRPVKPVFEIN